MTTLKTYSYVINGRIVKMLADFLSDELEPGFYKVLFDKISESSQITPMANYDAFEISRILEESSRVMNCDWDQLIKAWIRFSIEQLDTISRWILKLRGPQPYLEELPEYLHRWTNFIHMRRLPNRQNQYRWTIETPVDLFDWILDILQILISTVFRQNASLKTIERYNFKMDGGFQMTCGKILLSN